MSAQLVEKLRKRVIQNFMDIMVLTEMRKGSLSGYDAIGLIHHTFDIMLSPGTIYSLLYSMERDGLIKGVWHSRKRVYELTEKGEQNIKVIVKASEEVQNFLKTSHCSMQPANEEISLPTPLLFLPLQAMEFWTIPSKGSPIFPSQFLH